MHELVEEGDEQDDEAAAITELRDPERDSDHALRHVVETVAVDRQVHRMPCEEADETEPERQGEDLEPPARPSTEPVDDKPDTDHLAGLERVRQAQKGHGSHAP